MYYPSLNRNDDFEIGATDSDGGALIDHFILMIRIWCNQILKINVVPNVNIIANKYNNTTIIHKYSLWARNSSMYFTCINTYSPTATL